MKNNEFFKYNDIILKKMSVFLNCEPDFVTADIIKELCSEFSVSEEEAFSFILAAEIGLDVEENARDREIFELYFPKMIKKLNIEDFSNDPYLNEVKIPEKACGRWEFKLEKYKPYEAFACNDLLSLPDGRVIPQIGFFDSEFSYPAVLEGGREWMLITPNEINTMAKPIACARGKVLTYGLGLGYFAFMAARKEEVLSVTVVEKERAVIELFEKYIRPSLSCAEKIEIVCDDAFDFAENKMSEGKYDFVFADIWHDPSDGVSAYKRFKSLEYKLPCAEFLYWIEDTIKCYL